MTHIPTGILDRIEALEARIAALEAAARVPIAPVTHDEFPAEDLITTSVKSGALNFWWTTSDDEHVEEVKRAKNYEYRNPNTRTGAPVNREGGRFGSMV